MFKINSLQVKIVFSYLSQSAQVGYDEDKQVREYAEDECQQFDGEASVFLDQTFLESCAFHFSEPDRCQRVDTGRHSTATHRHTHRYFDFVISTKRNKCICRKP